MHLICYAGGTCGDLLTAMVDPTAADVVTGRLQLPTDRMRLKKPHQFRDTQEKDQYIEEASTRYRSLPSHDLEYHISKNHDFVGITVSDRQIAMWAATRFQKLHRPHVWQEMQRQCGASSLDEYAKILIDFSTLVASHTSKLVTLESILDGSVIDTIGVWCDPDIVLYQRWRHQQDL
jgi:hypothetical protein